MKIGNIGYCFVAIAVLGACSKETDTPAGIETEILSGPLKTKAVNFCANPEKGALIVYLDEEVCSGDSVTGTFDARLDSLGVLSCKRVFGYVPATEEKLRSRGMHRWYKLTFSESLEPHEVALRAAELPQVRRIEFEQRVRKQVVGQVKPYNPSVSTKAGPRAAEVDMPFNDTYLYEQWNYKNTGDPYFAPTARADADICAFEAWKLTGGDPSVVVAVVDEAVMTSHPDLKANMWVNEQEKNGVEGADDDGNGYIDDIYGYNFVDHGALNWDMPGEIGHGTHVAGIVAAVNNNNIGVCGVAGGTGKGDGVRIMSCQVFSGKNGGNISEISNAIRYAADNGACILQASLGYPPEKFTSDASFEESRSVEYAAIRYFMETRNCAALDGGLVVFAAGNDAAPWSAYPAGLTDVISVTSIASDNCAAYYTNYGDGCNIAAPGGEYYTGGSLAKESAILSTMPAGLSVELPEGGEQESGPYGYMQGTSMACPHVSGVAALGLSYALKLGKSYSMDEFKSMLLTSVTDVDKFMANAKYTNVGGTLAMMDLEHFKGKMGTGMTNAWRLLMQVEGTPTLIARKDDYNRLDLTSYMGKGAANLTFLSVEIGKDGYDALGLVEKPQIKSGKLLIFPTKTGAAKLTVRAVAGGDKLGSMSSMGGMEISKEISVMVRDIASNNGGWL